MVNLVSISKKKSPPFDVFFHLAPGDTGAGFWGDLHNCDLPYWTAELILQYASELEKVTK